MTAPARRTFNPREVLVASALPRLPALSLKGGVPILLSASVVLAEGETRSPDLARLQNIFRSPLVIDEIHFMLTGDITSDQVQNFGGSIRARFKLGRIDISEQFVPVWIHGPRLEDSGVPSVEEDLGAIAGQPAGDELTFNHFKWVLPKPLFVPVGSVLAPTFTRSLDTRGGAVTVDVAYGARRLPLGTPTPDLIDVPFIAAWLPAEVTVGGATTALSMAKDLYNPFTVSLNIQRFLGRVNQRFQHSGIGTNFDGSNSAFGAAIRVLIQDSLGYNLLRDFTPWMHVFDINRRAWTFQRSLKPKQWYTIQLENIGVALSTNQYLQPQISMVGWRKEVMR